MKQIFAALLALLPLLTFAKSFPVTSWDISAANETGWGESIPTTKTDFGAGAFDAAYPTALRATGDLSIWRLNFGTAASGTVFDLAKDGNHRVKVTDTTSNYYGFQFNCNESVFMFKGGVWDFNSTQCLALGYPKHGNTLIFDQAVLTNVLKVVLSYTESNNNNYGHTLVLTNSTLLNTTGDFMLGELGGFDNTVEINAGCKVSVKGKVLSESGGTVRGDANMKMTVRGEGAALSAPTVRWGVTSAGNRLKIENDAEVTCGTLDMGLNAAASNNVVLVDGGGRFSTSTAAYVGDKSANNALIVSNSTYKIVGGTLVIGKEVGATNAILRIAGSAAGLDWKSLSWTDDGPFGAAGYGVFELADHVLLSNNVPNMTIGKISDGNVFRLTDGAKILPEGSGALIYTAGAPASGQTAATKDNRIEILNDSSVRCYRLIAQGDNCGVVVSDSAVEINNSYEHGIVLGGTGSTGNYLRLEGDSPTVKTSWDVNGINMSNGARLEFVLPATPYAERVLRVCKIKADSSCAFKFDTRAIDGTTHDRLRYHLASVRFVESVAALDESVLAAANAELAPKGGTLAWEGQDLYLTFKSNKGFMLIFR